MKALVYLTDAAGNLTEKVLPAERDEGQENEVVNLYPEITCQRLEGFGGAVTDSAGFVFAQMPEDLQEQVLETYFTPAGLGYNRVRVPLDSCDFSTRLYEADGGKGEAFSFRETERYILPLLEAAQDKAGQPLKLMLSIWSPPARMKTNQQRTQGGRLRQSCYHAYAAYLCRYIEEFERRGYAVERISIQNEPHAVQRWDSCVYSAQEEGAFLRKALLPALKQHGLGYIECFIWDHNKERLYERVRDTVAAVGLEDISGAAFHWYSGDHFEALDLVQALYPDLKLILSESALEFRTYGRDSQLQSAEVMIHDIIGNMNHGVSAFYDWNLLLDAEGGPNHAGNFCEAPFLYDPSAHILEERRVLRYYWHLAHFIQPGAVRIGISRYTDRLDVTAWRNPDGKIILVAANRSDTPKSIHLRISGQLIRMELPAHAVLSGMLLESET